MNVIKQIAEDIYYYFTIDLPVYFDLLPLPGKILLIALGILVAPIIVQLLLLIFGLIFVHIMAAFNSNKTFEPLYPIEEIAVIEIIEITEDVGLYFHPVDEIAGILDSNTTVITELDNSCIEACMDDLLDLSASQWWNDPNPYIQDGTIRITYQNGSREWICAEGTFYYNSSEDDASMTWYYFDNDDFTTYLQKYGYQQP